MQRIQVLKSPELFSKMGEKTVTAIVCHQPFFRKKKHSKTVLHLQTFRTRQLNIVEEDLYSNHKDSVDLVQN